MTQNAAEQRQLAAIMFTDMVGYSALCQKNESLALELLEEHRQLLRPIFSKHHGTEIKTIGDAFLVEFHSPVEAVRSAIAMQQALHEHNQTSAPERQLRIRIGVHLGDVVHRDGDVYGDGVNIASRIEPLAGPGGICVTQQVYDHVHNKVAEPFNKLGAGDLENISVPVNIYRVTLPWADHRSPLAEQLRFRLRQKGVRTWATAMLVIAVVSGMVVWRNRDRQPVTTSSIAVLPFDNLTADTNNSYLTEGIAEDLTTVLSQVQGLRVPGRTSAQLSYKANHKAFTRIGEQLGVAWVLEGSVREVGEKKIRLNAQLISARDHHHLWATNFDRTPAQLATVHYELARGILGALQVNVPKSLASQKPPPDPAAFKLFLRGRQQLNLRTADGLRKGRELFDQAIEIEPAYAEAHSGKAECYNYLAYGNHSAPKDAFPKAMAAAREALRFNSDLAEAHAALGFAKLYYEWNWGGAEEEFKHSVRLNPGSAVARHYYSVFLTASERPKEAQREIEQAQGLDPLSVPIATDMAFQLYYDRRYAEAIRHLKDALDMNPDFPLARFWLGRVYTSMKSNELARAEFEAADLKLGVWQPMLAAKGFFFGTTQKQDDAMKVLATFDTLERQGKFVTSYGRALVYTGLGDRENAFRWLNRAWEERSHWLIWLKLDPRWDSLRNESEFKELVKKVGLPR